jgi:hypothetical protein
MGLLDQIIGSAGDWRDRLQPAAFTSPSGKRMEFEFLATPSDTETRTQASAFPGVNGVYVQSFGSGAATFPITAIFQGANADLGRAAFAELLAEPGIGKLEHPTRGTFDVVVTGGIGYRDDVVESANIYSVETSFTATLRGAWPLAEPSVAASLVSAFGAYNTAQAALFASQLDTGLVSDLQRFRADYRDTMRTIRGSLASVAAAQDSTRYAFESVFADIALGIDMLITQPANLMFKQQMLLALPGSMLRRLSATATASFSLAVSVLTGISAYSGQTSRLRSPANATRHTTSDRNAFAVNDHAVASALIPAAIGLLDVGYKTRGEAIAAAVALLGVLDATVAWRDEVIAAEDPSTNPNGQGEANPLWPDVVSIVERAAGALVQKSFSLAQTRSMQLDRDRTPLDLVAELYGDLSRLDEFASANSLGSEEQLIIRRGRVVEWLA